jgi:bifunctional non-homologous end joining protein LigD
MTKSLRTGKVFVDWSQNNPAKTTVAPYSLRARPHPTVSTPVTWDEVADGRELSFTAGDVLERVAEHGDLFAGVLDDRNRARLPGPPAEPASASRSAKTSRTSKTPKKKDGRR